ncbi:MDR family MFS transporter [Marinifilum caeruleilacunae]|uniref:DHA2 family efflux MFS transporter permease subunit n=1 Tax=Marinifilum caeruleilacunae TaxID=2499076 RepID=A0ABX1X178_9BACT|nr:MDR family MFS transporter [Marinifilum caeruleilacunae]NOU62125.1 DHA2 family efflux MFS transporter permease subunit [Marinifilum caeruleilacunae]
MKTQETLENDTMIVSVNKTQVNNSRKKALITETNEKKVEYTAKQRTLIMLPLLMGGFVALVNETLLSVAFPQLMSNLNVSLGTVQWLASGYMLVIGVLLPVVAFLLKSFSTKKLYLTAMTLLSLGALFCGLSQSFNMLLIFRLVQGAGAAVLLPIMLDVIFNIYPPNKRGAAMGISMMIVVFAPAIGPTISGLILEHLNWHWLFFSILPLAIISIIIGSKTLMNVTKLTKPRIDILSVVLSTIGFGGLIYAINSIEGKELTNPQVLISLLLGIVALIFFIKRQFILKQPMLNLRVFSFPMFSLGAFMLFIAFMMPFAVGIILPIYILDVLKLSPIIAGAALLPGSIMNMIITPLSGRIYDKNGARILVIIGFITLTVAMYFLSNISTSESVYWLIAMHICINLGVSMIITPSQTNSLNQLPKKIGSDGIAVLNTIVQIAAAFGSSLFIGIMGTTQEKQLGLLQNPGIAEQQSATTAGISLAFLSALVMASIGLLASFFIKRRINQPKYAKINLN